MVIVCNMAPIVIFTYKRLWHTHQTIEALKNNELAEKSTFFIFSDAPKSQKEKKAVEEVRKYIKSIKGFKEVIVIEREKNYGLAKNIIDGVTRVVNRYGKVIVLEDDIVTSPYFLKYMNEALEFYKNNEKVMHISGYIYPVNNESLPDFFFLKPTSCWGWGTWKRAWRFFKKDCDYFMKLFSKEMIYDFNLSNSYNYWAQIIANKKGKINTWAIFWYASVYINGGLSLHPKISFTNNIGHDGSGEHCGEEKCFLWNKLNETSEFVFPEIVEEHYEARKRIEEFFRSAKIPLWKKLLRKVENLFVQRY